MALLRAIMVKELSKCPVADFNPSLRKRAVCSDV